MDPRITVAYMTDTTLSTFEPGDRVRTVKSLAVIGNTLYSEVPEGTTGTVHVADPILANLGLVAVLVDEYSPDGKVWHFYPRDIERVVEKTEEPEQTAETDNPVDTALNHLLFHLGEQAGLIIEALPEVTDDPTRYAMSGYLEALEDVQAVAEHVRG